MSKDTEPFLDQALATIAGLDTAASTLGGALRRTDATDLADAKADALRLHREKMDLFEENFRLRSALIHVRGDH